MLPESVKKYVEEVFQTLIDPVKILLRKNDSDLSKKAEELLKEIASLNEKVQFQISENLSCLDYPCISIQGLEKDFGIRYMGVPEGGEFNVFIETIKMVSRNEYHLTERTVEFVEEIDKPVDIKVFVTTSCGWCPPAIQKAYSFALVSDYITATAIDCYAFPDLAMKYNVAAVPKIVINDKAEIIGPKDENEILGHIFSTLG
ncbi:MAG: glutaredoxin [Aquificae bacterium]|nr:glutaredoxin [Aquificota bacterium]